MKRFSKNIFIPHQGNKYEPYGLRFKTLAGYLIILIILQLGVNFLAEPRTTQKALAAVGISSGELASLTNAQRAAYGLSTLSVDGRLNNASYNKCMDMFANQYWDHTSPSGLTPWYFISQAGYTYIYAGENLAKGFNSSSEIINAWMNSPSHRANILSNNFQDMGTAVMTGNFQGVRTTLCVQMFGAKKAYVPAPVPVAPSTPSYQPPAEQPTIPVPAPTEEQKPPSVPEITEPKQGEILNNNKPAISGKSSRDTQVAIYDQKDKIGLSNTEPEGIFIFKPVDALKEGEHKISVEASYKTGLKSDESKPVVFTIDTIPPLIEEGSLKADSFLKSNLENYKVAVEVKKKPSEVTASLDHYSLILNKDKEKKDLFEGTLIPPPETLTEDPRKLTITSIDKADNRASYLITIPKPEIIQQGVIQRMGTAIKSYLPHDFQNIVRLLYFILGFWIFVLLLIDGVFVYTKGIVRVRSYSRAHLVIIFLMLTGILFASLGTII
jgi:uncharacterized protein YkwD